jgi:hypothetical protein
MSFFLVAFFIFKLIQQREFFFSISILYRIIRKHNEMNENSYIFCVKFERRTDRKSLSLTQLTIDAKSQLTSRLLIESFTRVKLSSP